MRSPRHELGRGSREGLSGGYSMVELLVAVLVVGVGVLGAAALQLESARNTRHALERTTAVMLAQDLIERIRANPAGTYADVAAGDAPPSYVDCLARDCEPDELAAFDLAVWKCALGSWHESAPCRAARAAGVLPDVAGQPGLPEGDGELASSGDGFAVTVTWEGGRTHRVVLGGRR